jgi:hypothetical protein
MPDIPKYTQLLSDEIVTRKSKGPGISAYLWFDEQGKIYTKKHVQATLSSLINA